jgi:hypothetical protein
LGVRDVLVRPANLAPAASRTRRSTVDGEPVRSRFAAGRFDRRPKITTIEGIGETEAGRKVEGVAGSRVVTRLLPVRQIMSAAALLARRPEPADPTSTRPWLETFAGKAYSSARGQTKSTPPGPK